MSSFACGGRHQQKREMRAWCSVARAEDPSTTAAVKCGAAPQVALGEEGQDSTYTQHHMRAGIPVEKEERRTASPFAWGCNTPGPAWEMKKVCLGRTV